MQFDREFRGFTEGQRDTKVSARVEVINTHAMFGVHAVVASTLMP